MTENAGHENDGPSKLQDILQDKKLTDQCARHEIAGHEIDGPIFEAFARHEIAGHENDGPSLYGHKSAQAENAGHENAGHEIAGHEIARQNSITLHQVKSSQVAFNK